MIVLKTMMNWSLHLKGLNISKLKNLELDMKNFNSPPTKPSIKDTPKSDLKDLPSNLRYVLFHRYGTLPVIIVVDLNVEQLEVLVFVLKRFKRAIGRTVWHISGIPPMISSNKIKIMSDHKPSIENKRRLNSLMQEVVTKKLIKCLDSTVIHPIDDSS